MCEEGIWSKQVAHPTQVLPDDLIRSRVIYVVIFQVVSKATLHTSHCNVATVPEKMWPSCRFMRYIKRRILYNGFVGLLYHR